MQWWSIYFLESNDFVVLRSDQKGIKVFKKMKKNAKKIKKCKIIILYIKKTRKNYFQLFVRTRNNDFNRDFFLKIDEL